MEGGHEGGFRFDSVRGPGWIEAPSVSFSRAAASVGLPVFDTICTRPTVLIRTYRLLEAKRV